MRILIDIGHPAHVHYFRNFITHMITNGHSIKVTARDKEMTFELLNRYGIEFNSRGKGSKIFIMKILYMPIAYYRIYKVARKFKPDLFLSYSSPYAALVSKLFRRPNITLDDTEHSKYELLFYRYFSDAFLNPNSYYKFLGNKQIKFDSVMHLSYLHQKYYTPNIDVLKWMNIGVDEPYAIVRFVAWNANHDLGIVGLSRENKILLIDRLINAGIKVFISSETELPLELKKYQIPFPAERLHDALFFAKVYIGEGATTASESAILGTPAIYVNPLLMGYIEDEIKAGLVYHATDINEILRILSIILKNNDSDERYYFLKEKFIATKIDLTSFLIWFIENWSDSFRVMKEIPNFQYNFR